MAGRSEIFHRYAVLVAAATFALIIAGGLVTSTGSGLAVPDWPLSYGTLFPPMVGGIRFEHTHRVIAGGVALLTAGLVIAAWKAEPRRWMRTLAAAALGAVFLQALLGGLTVLTRLPAPVSVAHACLGQVFFTLTALVAFGSSEAWRRPSGLAADAARPIFAAAAAAAAAVFLQLVLGAVVRHTAGGVVWHVANAFVVLFAALALRLQTASREGVPAGAARAAGAVGLLVLVQFFLGLGAFATTVALRRPEGAPAPAGEVFFATAHQATGALVLAAATAAAAYFGKAWREGA
jgi:cytochrome c oxidase assembly protein subunit 15